jgi:hypothetical protein
MTLAGDSSYRCMRIRQFCALLNVVSAGKGWSGKTAGHGWDFRRLQDDL